MILSDTRYLRDSRVSYLNISTVFVVFAIFVVHCLTADLELVLIVIRDIYITYACGFTSGLRLLTGRLS